MLVSLFVASILASAISGEVVQLDTGNFDAVIDGSRNVLVKFYAEWCGPCKLLSPIMHQVSSQFSDIDGETVIAEIDADTEHEIGERCQIDAFPTVRLFLKGRSHDEAIDYTGGRTPQAIHSFLRQTIEANDASLAEQMIEAPARSSLRELLKQLAAQAPKQQHPRYMASPFFKKATKPKNKKKSSSKKQLQSPKPKSGVIPDLSGSAAKKLIANTRDKPVILIFYSHSCPHCSEFLPVANSIAASRPDAVFIKVEGQLNYAFRDKFSIRYYPTIIGFYPNSGGNRWITFEGSRSTSSINSFIARLISGHKAQPVAAAATAAAAAAAVGPVVAGQVVAVEPVAAAAQPIAQPLAAQPLAAQPIAA